MGKIRGTQLNITLLDCKGLKKGNNGELRNVQVQFQVEDLVATSKFVNGTIDPVFNEQFQVVLKSKSAPTLYVEVVHKDDPDQEGGKEVTLGTSKVNLALIEDRPARDVSYTLEKKDFRQEVSGEIHLKVEYTHKVDMDPDEKPIFSKSAHVAKKKGGVLEFYMNEVDKIRSHGEKLEERVQKAEPMVKELSKKVERRDELMKALEKGAETLKQLQELEAHKKELQDAYKQLKADNEEKDLALRQKEKKILQLEMMAKHSKTAAKSMMKSMRSLNPADASAEESRAAEDQLAGAFGDLELDGQRDEDDDGAEDDDEDDEPDSGLIDDEDGAAMGGEEAIKLRKQVQSVTKKFERELNAKNEWKDKCLELQEMYNEMVQSKKAAADESDMKKKMEMVEQMRQQVEETTIQLKLTESQLEEAMKKYRKEARERKKLYNEIQELKGNIRVYCRCRPIQAFEMKDGITDVTSFGELDDVTISNFETGKTTNFEFDACFDQETTQEKVFEDTKPLMQSVIDGYNVCVFAYGQTGSGKTYTMQGVVGTEKEGVNVRALRELFRLVEEKGADYDFEMSIGVFEIYCEMIKDLLNGNEDLQIRQGKDAVGRTINYIENLSNEVVRDVDSVLKVIEKANGFRKTVTTKMNPESSRSHLIMSVDVATIDRLSGKRTQSHLNMIDLAGSERVGKSGVQGQNMKEAQAINQSLSALGNVLAALGKGTSHVPYRNSKLTHSLADSLGGNSKVLMFANINPISSNVSETLSTLNWATRARKVELGQAKANVSSDSAPPAEDAAPAASSASSSAKKDLRSGQENRRLPPLDRGSARRGRR